MVLVDMVVGWLNFVSDWSWCVFIWGILISFRAILVVDYITIILRARVKIVNGCLNN